MKMILLLDPLSKRGREAALKASEWRHCKDKACAQRFMSKQAIKWAESQEAANVELKHSKLRQSDYMSMFFLAMTFTIMRWIDERWADLLSAFAVCSIKRLSSRPPGIGLFCSQVRDTAKTKGPFNAVSATVKMSVKGVQPLVDLHKQRRSIFVNIKGSAKIDAAAGWSSFAQQERERS